MKKFIMLLALLPACNMAPRYERPCMEVPCSWRVESNEGSTCANARWWECFDDPILNALILEALAYNRDLKVAAWRVCEFISQYEVVRSQLFPQVALDASAVKEQIPAAANLLPIGVNPITPFYTWDFTLAYEIDLWGSLRNATEAAAAEALASVENRRTVVLSLVSAVAAAYVTLRELDCELAISKATLESRAESLRIARYRFEGGLTSEIEVYQAESLYEEAAAVVVTLEEQIPQQENLLSVLVGTYPTCIQRGKAVDRFVKPPVVPAGLPSDLLARRPDIMAAELDLIAANAQIGVARAAFFPEITLTGLYGGESFQLKTLFAGSSRQWQIGGTLMQAIFTGGRLMGQLGESEAIYMELLNRYEQVILTAFEEVDDALIAYKQNQELVIVLQKRVAAQKEYVKLAWLRYYEGQNDYLTVLDAERELFRGELDLAQAQGSVFIALVDIYKALGGGWVLDADCIGDDLAPYPPCDSPLPLPLG